MTPPTTPTTLGAVHQTALNEPLERQVPTHGRRHDSPQRAPPRAEELVDGLPLAEAHPHGLVASTSPTGITRLASPMAVTSRLPHATWLTGSLCSPSSKRAESARRRRPPPAPRYPSRSRPTKSSGALTSSHAQLVATSFTVLLRIPATQRALACPPRVDSEPPAPLGREGARDGDLHRCPGCRRRLLLLIPQPLPAPSPDHPRSPPGPLPPVRSPRPQLHRRGRGRLQFPLPQHPAIRLIKHRPK